MTRCKPDRSISQPCHLVVINTSLRSTPALASSWQHTLHGNCAGGVQDRASGTTPWSRYISASHPNGLKTHMRRKNTASSKKYQSGNHSKWPGGHDVTSNTGELDKFWQLRALLCQFLFHPAGSNSQQWPMHWTFPIHQCLTRKGTVCADMLMFFCSSINSMLL